MHFTNFKKFIISGRSVWKIIVKSGIYILVKWDIYPFLFNLNTGGITMTKQHLIHRLVGPSGHYLSGLWEPQEVLINLFWSADVATSRTIAVQIINGHRPLPAKYNKTYRGNNGLSVLETDLWAFLQHYHSTAMLIDICVQIHTTVVTSDWSHEQIAALEVYYTADNPSRDQIAIYITHVMYSIICT